MSLTEDMMKRMTEAARKLRKGGPRAATTAIQDALKGYANSRGTAPPAPPAGPMPAFVQDLLEQLGVGQPADAGAQADAVIPSAAGAALPGQFVSASFTNHAGTRAYKVYIPSSYQGQAMPLMVMLHGCTQDPDDFAAGTRMNQLAEEKQCFIVYPAQSQSANNSRCWNWFNAVDQQHGQGEPSIIAGITEEVIAKYKLDRQQVYVAGMSAGGAMAIILGTTYPELYAAVGVHSGLPYAAAKDLPSAMAAMRGQGKSAASASKLKSIPIIVFHGDRDTTVHAQNGDSLMAQSLAGLRATGEVPVNPDALVESGQIPNGHAYTTSSHLNAAGHTIAEHWVIHGAGHAWSGGSRHGSYTDPQGPDASQEMLRFFATQTRGRSARGVRPSDAV